MKISIIVPSFKPGNYIAKCISSIQAQDFPKKDYEVIIVLNGCSEPYKSRIEQIINNPNSDHEKSNIHLIQTDHPGVSHARNLGIKEARGEYIIFIDDDDYISPNYLSNLYALASPDTIVASNAKNSIDEKGQTQDNFISKAFQNLKDNPTSLFANRRLLSTVWGKIIPKKIIEDVRFRENLSLGEDSVFMAEISTRIKYVRTTSPDIFYYVTVRPNSSSRKSISNWAQISNSLELAWTFFTIYISNIRSYNFSFFLSRIVASLLKMISKKYRTA